MRLYLLDRQVPPPLRTTIGKSSVTTGMAGHIAEYLASEGRRLTVHNRTKEKAKQLLERDNVDWCAVCAVISVSRWARVPRPGSVQIAACRHVNDRPHDGLLCRQLHTGYQCWLQETQAVWHTTACKRLAWLVARFFMMP